MGGLGGENPAETIESDRLVGCETGAFEPTRHAPGQLDALPRIVVVCFCKNEGDKRRRVGRLQRFDERIVMQRRRGDDITASREQQQRLSDQFANVFRRVEATRIE